RPEPGPLCHPAVGGPAGRTESRRGGPELLWWGEAGVAGGRRILHAPCPDPRAPFSGAERRIGARVWRVSEDEQLADEAQKLPVQVAASLTRAENGGLHVGAVAIGDPASRLHVGPVDREGGDHLSQRISQIPARMVAMPAVALANVRQQR